MRHLGQNLAHPVRGQYTVKLMIDAYCPRQRIALRPSLDDRHRPAASTQHQCQRLANRAVSDLNHVIPGVCHSLTYGWPAA